MGHIKNNINLSKEAVIFKRFPGHTAEEIAFYAPKPLCDNQPDHVIVIAGTNDLTKSFYENASVDEFEVVESILKIGRAARERGAKKVFLSSIMNRRGYQYREAVGKVNDILYMACVAEGFVFMDQRNIALGHISQDGIHLNTEGTTILKFNILSAFNTFDTNRMDFRDDYERALSVY